VRRKFFLAAVLGLAPGCGAAFERPVDESADTQAAEFATDPCVEKATACPATSAPEGKGLVAVDRCAFRVAESFSDGSVLGALEKIAPHASLSDVLADLDNTGSTAASVAGNPAGLTRVFGWEADDNDSANWIPQGLTGSADGSGGTFEGKQLFLSSWYDKTGNKGVRIAIVDGTRATAKYRFALLVTPSGTAAAPSFSAVPIHAGGLAWFGNYLYVVDTTKGFRVFDLTRILKTEADSTKSAIGCTGGTCKAFDYRYVIPQVGAYTQQSSCAPRFSFVSLDRSTNPPSLLSGEWCDGIACPVLGGRLYRWELDPATARINRAFPKDAFLMGQSHVQGGAASGSVYYLSSSKPKGTAGALYRVTASASKTSSWAEGPEDLMIDGDLIYSQTENAPRAIFGVRKSSY
jgi:hypothetical protein